MATITKAELARRFGVNRAQPTRWAEQGMPVLPGGNVDEAAATAWVRSNVDPGARTSRHGGSGSRSGSRDPDPKRQARLDAIDDLARLAMKLVADRVPTLVAHLALEAGLPIKTARALHDASRTRMAAEANDVREEWCCIGPGETGPLTTLRGLSDEEWATLAGTAPRQPRQPGR